MGTAKIDKKPSNIRVKIISIILILFLSWALLTIYEQLIDIKIIKNELGVLNQEHQEVISNNEELNKEVQLLQNDEYIANLAREYYFLSKPGEILIISPEY